MKTAIILLLGAFTSLGYAKDIILNCSSAAAQLQVEITTNMNKTPDHRIPGVIISKENQLTQKYYWKNSLDSLDSLDKNQGGVVLASVQYSPNLSQGAAGLMVLVGQQQTDKSISAILSLDGLMYALSCQR